MLRLVLTVLTAALIPVFAPAQPAPGPDKTIDAADRKAVIDGVLKRVTENYVFPDVGKKMEEAVRARQAKGEYDSISSGREFAKVLTDHLREVCKDKHLRVNFSPEPTPAGGPGGPSAEQMARMRRFAALRNFGFKKLERLDGGVGLLELENFLPAELIGETAGAAMTFLANSEAVIVDLRANGGGDPAAVVLLCSYFFDESTHLNSIYNRSSDTTRQYWSLPAVPGKKLTGKDVYVLTSGRTFSGAEEFAYNLQSQKKATIIGETTGGGAHPTRGFRVTDHFGVGVPFARSINPVTKTNWEGTGVKPDVAVPADQALLTAHLMAAKKGLEKVADDRQAKDYLGGIVTRLEKELEAAKAGKATKPERP